PQPSARPPPRGYASSGSRISPGSARRKGSARRRIRTMHSHPLPRELFSRIDESPDEQFYAAPRLVTHIDEAAIAAVTRLYREYFPPGGAVLDLMSSWVSHLPPEVAYRKVVGLGMNSAELAANPRFARWVVHDLNEKPSLPFEAGQFDAATICVSIQYLTQPATVLRDVARVL